MISTIFPPEFKFLRKAETLKPNFLPSQSNDSHSSFDQKIEIWNSECGMTIAMNMRMKSRNPVWLFFAGVGGGEEMVREGNLFCVVRN